MGFYRIIDANINRVAEGLRVLEDVYRFVLNSRKISKELRILRHDVRKGFSSKELLRSRDSLGDVGLINSQESRLDDKTSLQDLVKSNFKRVEEGLRSIEEALKLVGFYRESKNYENIRYRVYNLEKEALEPAQPLDTDLYVILGQDFSSGRSNLEVFKELMEAGIKTVQYREKDKSKQEKFKECRQIKELIGDRDIFFIVNDDLDLALAVGADGLHIGQDDLDLEIARAAAPGLKIGLSTHNKEEALEAVRKGADYIGVGPIFETSSKKDLSEIAGLDYLAWVAENIDLPYVAIGGIKEDNILQVKEHGASCFAMISEIVGAGDIAGKIKNIRKKLEDE